MGRISPNYQNYRSINTFSPPGTGTVSQTLAFSELSTYSIEELEFLKDSEERRIEFLESLHQVRDMNRTVDDMISQVEELAGKSSIFIIFSVFVADK